MASPEPQLGDLIEIFFTFYSHWGVYVGSGSVVHLVPSEKFAGAGGARFWPALADRAIVKKEQLRDVVGRHPYMVNNKHDDKYKPFPPSKIIQWAEELVGQELCYSLISNNCEHFVKELRYRVSCSNQPEPQLGDLIEIFHFIYSHWAVYVGGGYVVHLVPSGGISGTGKSSSMTSAADRAIVKKERLCDIVGKNGCKVNNKHDDKYKPFPPTIIVHHAEKLVGQELCYSLMNRNCEHFVNELRYGVSRSDQVGDAEISPINMVASLIHHFLD